MGWPKGKPRKGHVNKNGTVHLKWGSLAAAREAIKVTVPKRGRPPKDPNAKKWNTKLTNKGIERCPNCEFPEAYGGYCNECDWMAPITLRN